MYVADWKQFSVTGCGQATGSRIGDDGTGDISLARGSGYVSEQGEGRQNRKQTAPSGMFPVRGRRCKGGVTAGVTEVGVESSSACTEAIVRG